MVIERGVLRSYLLNAYCARKLGLATTGIMLAAGRSSMAARMFD